MNALPHRTMSMDRKTYSTREVAELTGLAYASVITYARQYPDLVSVERMGGRLRFPPSAIAALKQLKEAKMSGRSRRGSAEAVRERLLASLKSMRQTTLGVSRDLDSAIARLEGYRPATAVWIHTLPEGPYRLKQPISVMVERVEGTFVATFAEADLDASGKTWKDAVHRLRVLILRTLIRLREEPPTDPPALGQLYALCELTVADERRHGDGGSNGTEEAG